MISQEPLADRQAFLVDFARPRKVVELHAHITEHHVANAEPVQRVSVRLIASPLKVDCQGLLVDLAAPAKSFIALRESPTFS